VDLGSIRAAFEALAARHECVIVEGAGGLLVPLAARAYMADLSRELGLPLLIVAHARLGTINHTLLTLEAARARGLAVAGIVVSHSGAPISAAERSNLDHLRESLGRSWLGELPRLAPGEAAPGGWIDLDALMAALRQAPGYSGAPAA
jgi:dethiobiotin synthetase